MIMERKVIDMLKSMTQAELNNVINYCQYEAKQRSAFNAFDEILRDSNRILEIALTDGTYVYADQVVEAVAFTGGYAVRFGILGKDVLKTQETIRLEFDTRHKGSHLPFTSASPTIFLDEGECLYTTEVNGVKTIDEGLPVKALSVCMLYRSCYDCAQAIPFDMECMSALKEIAQKVKDKPELIEQRTDLSKLFGTDKNSNNEEDEISKFIDGLADTINKCLCVNEDKSAEEADSTGDSEDDESLIKQEIIDSVKEPLQSLAGFVNANDNVKLYTTYKVDRHEKTDANGVKRESRSTQTINDLYNNLKVTQVNDGIRLTFANDFNDNIDEYEIDMLFSDCDDVVDPLQIEKNGTIHVALCDSAKLKMVVSKDGKALSRKAVEALMYA
jgi:hypothetical protein